MPALGESLLPQTGGRLWLSVIGFGTFCAVVHAGLVGVSDHVSQVNTFDQWTKDTVFELLSDGFITWYLWTFLSLPVFHMVRVLIGRRISAPVLFLFHVAAGSVFIAIYVTLMALVFAIRDQLVADMPLTWIEYMRVLSALLVYFFAVYLGIIAACYAFLYYRPALKASQLESRLTRAKLQALQMQLHPHFLFNALNSISVLVHRDPDTADRMISRLSDLLRLTLSSDGRQTVPLRQELEILDKYMEIELVRFQNRLRIEKDIAPDVLGAIVPSLALQPLVENSIKHGIAKSSTAGWIGISAWREGDYLTLEVSDDGPGVMGSTRELLGRGVGLTNAKERLQQLYGDDQLFEIESRSELGAKMGLPETETGLVVRIRIPFREDRGDSSGRAGRSEAR